MTIGISFNNLLLFCELIFIFSAHNYYKSLSVKTNFNIFQLFLQISEIIDIMKMMVKDQDQEKKLTEMFASGLLLNDNANLATDVNRILQTLNDLRL